MAAQQVQTTPEEVISFFIILDPYLSHPFMQDQHRTYYQDRTSSRFLTLRVLELLISKFISRDVL